MADEFEPMEGLEEEFQIHDYDIMDLFEEQSFKEKWQRVFSGLKEDKDTGAYKYAKLQMTRLAGPAAAVVVPMLFMGLLLIFASLTPDKQTSVPVTIMEPEPIEELEDIEEIEPEEIEPPEPMDEMTDEFSPDVNVDTPSPPTDFSPQPAEFDAVAMVKSPVIMRGIYGSRNPGARGAAMAGYGGSGAGEASVLRTLRWLKKYQNANGSWDNATGGLAGHGQKAPPAHAAIGLLTFLAHGETPASPEFGATVEKAIRYLVDGQDAKGTFKGKDQHNYTQPIVAYAVSEAYALTKVPILKETAEKAIQIVIDGQHPNGGWDYNCKQSERDDTSYMGWCAQAIKAAKMADLSNDGLDKVYKNARNGFKKNFKAGGDGTGGFGYTGPGKAGGLSGVGVLCMQLTGAAKAPEVTQGLMGIKKAHTVSWAAPKGNIYFWYYDTQAMFHTGGEMWNSWNRMFAPTMTKNQTIVKGKYEYKGRQFDIGYWLPPGGKSKHTSTMFDTALCALSLQVYYRYLPTYKPPAKDEIVEDAPSDDDIVIEIDI